jgi:hypothetical protein
MRPLAAVSCPGRIVLSEAAGSPKRRTALIALTEPREARADRGSSQE